MAMAPGAAGVFSAVPQPAEFAEILADQVGPQAAEALTEANAVGKTLIREKLAIKQAATAYKGGEFYHARSGLSRKTWAGEKFQER
ncbi:MAG: hypothetical protein WDA20_05010 [Desulfuromonadales bacterium]